MADAATRRKLRRNRILENSAARLQRITGQTSTKPPLEHNSAILYNDNHPYILLWQSPAFSKWKYAFCSLNPVQHKARNNPSPTNAIQSIMYCLQRTLLLLIQLRTNLLLIHVLPARFRVSCI
ncbi:uncharacterized protein [Fopius arisanus]|uniref:Uncharacterized protein isoform X2 n=1 Tax=Fopius arisanus TaxID=64838 RepID=A0A9R1TLK2_9HYME|nr:PREDICTED: uncharacterized protein LOC105271750 isoform X2 [Fopius arisanus]